MFELNKARLAPKFCIRENEKIVPAADFLNLVQGLVGYLQNKKAASLALCIEDSCLFAAALFAGLSLDKNIILLPNNKKPTVNYFAGEFDEVLTDENIKDVTPVMGEFSFTIHKNAKITFFTSGSGGIPKKSLKRFENLFLEVGVLEELFGSQIKTAVVLSTVTHQHMYGFLFKILWPICFGRCFGAFTVEYPEELGKMVRAHNSVALVSSPAFLKRYFLVESVSPMLNAVFSSGGKLDFNVACATRQNLGVVPVEVYGSTESGGMAYREQSSANQPWMVFPGVVLQQEEKDGPLVAKSPYFDEPFLLTGDRAEMYADGRFQLLDRLDDVVKIEEKRVSLTELNKKILSSILIFESVVLELEENGRQQTACLAVLSEEGSKALKTEGKLKVCKALRELLLTHFDALVVPKKFRFVNELPYTSQYKLIKKDLAGYFNDVV